MSVAYLSDAAEGMQLNRSHVMLDTSGWWARSGIMDGCR